MPRKTQCISCKHFISLSKCAIKGSNLEYDDRTCDDFETDIEIIKRNEDNKYVLNINSEQTEEEAVKQIYEFANNLLFKEKKNSKDVIKELVNNGIDNKNAEIVVGNLLSSRKERANKDMLYGALWCIGGTIATVADFGYIFWGAIVFGAIQFFRGLINHR